MTKKPSENGLSQILALYCNLGKIWPFLGGKRGKWWKIFLGKWFISNFKQNDQLFEKIKFFGLLDQVPHVTRRSVWTKVLSRKNPFAWLMYTYEVLRKTQNQNFKSTFLPAKDKNSQNWPILPLKKLLGLLFLDWNGSRYSRNLILSEILGLRIFLG